MFQLQKTANCQLSQDDVVPVEEAIEIKQVISRTDPWALILIYEQNSQRWLSAYKLAPMVFADKTAEERDRLPS